MNESWSNNNNPGSNITYFESTDDTVLTAYDVVLKIVLFLGILGNTRVHAAVRQNRQLRILNRIGERKSPIGDFSTVFIFNRAVQSFRCRRR